MKVKLWPGYNSSLTTCLKGYGLLFPNPRLGFVHSGHNTCFYISRNIIYMYMSQLAARKISFCYHYSTCVNHVTIWWNTFTVGCSFTLCFMFSLSLFLSFSTQIVNPLASPSLCIWTFAWIWNGLFDRREQKRVTTSHGHSQFISTMLLQFDKWNYSVTVNTMKTDGQYLKNKICLCFFYFSNMKLLNLFLVLHLCSYTFWLWLIEIVIDSIELAQYGW